jgi:hypothetical protein
MAGVLGESISLKLVTKPSKRPGKDFSAHFHPRNFTLPSSVGLDRAGQSFEFSLAFATHNLS